MGDDWSEPTDESPFETDWVRGYVEHTGGNIWVREWCSRDPRPEEPYDDVDEIYRVGYGDGFHGVGIERLTWNESLSAYMFSGQIAGVDILERDDVPLTDESCIRIARAFIENIEFFVDE